MLCVHPGSQASSRGEAKDSALLSSRDAGLLEPPVLILFPGRDAVLPGLIPTQGFMALVLHPLSSQAPDRKSVV